MVTTYDPKCADLAEDFLTDESHLYTESNIDALAKAIQQAIEDWIDVARDNYDPTPYCSYGHKTKASCDCGPIAANE